MRRPRPQRQRHPECEHVGPVFPERSQSAPMGKQILNTGTITACDKKRWRKRQRGNPPRQVGENGGPDTTRDIEGHKNGEGVPMLESDSRGRESTKAEGKKIT
jgi:hypothetical protein